MQEDAGIRHELNKVEPSPFPLSKDVVRESLNDISENPLLSINEIRLFQKDSVITKTIYAATKAARGKVFDVSAFREGSFFAFKMIKDSAEAKGIEIPVRDARDLSFSYVNNLEHVSWGHNDSKYYTPIMEQLRSEDPNFVESIEQMCQYRPGRTEFYNGAVSVYQVISEAFKNKK